jgi:hypothetical protein
MGGRNGRGLRPLHEIRFFRFNLQITTSVTITVAAVDALALLPAFSIYSGLAHMPAQGLDYETPVVFSYLATLPARPRKELSWRLATGRWATITTYR